MTFYLKEFLLSAKRVILCIVFLQLPGCAMSYLSTSHIDTPGGNFNKKDCTATCIQKTTNPDGVEVCLKFSSGMAETCSKLTNKTITDTPKSTATSITTNIITNTTTNTNLNTNTTTNTNSNTNTNTAPDTTSNITPDTTPDTTSNITPDITPDTTPEDTIVEDNPR